MMMLKEEFVGGEKYRRAVKLGRADAILMWLALKRYASSHPSSEGFVPDEDVDDLPGAPRAARKAIKALVDCGRLLPDGSRGYGLIEPAPGGWQMHDYLDHAETPEDDELRRERARQKKQQQRELKRRELDLVRSLSLGTGVGQTGDTDGDRRGTPTGTDGGQTRDKPGDTDGDKPGVSLAGERPGPCVQAPAPTRAPARSQPNPTQPTLFCPDPESAREVDREPDQQPEPERATPPPPSATRTQGGVPVWSEYPKGWRWSPATAAAAAARGVTAAELQEQVNWRTLHPWSVPTNDLDGELVHSLDGIIARRSKAARGGMGPPPSDPYAWAPIAEHRAFATSKGLDLAVAADAYRAAKRPDDLGTLRANEDFMRRLKCWAATGGDFIPMGPLRRTQGGAPEPARGVA